MSVAPRRSSASRMGSGKPQTPSTHPERVAATSEPLSAALPGVTRIRRSLAPAMPRSERTAARGTVSEITSGSVTSYSPSVGIVIESSASETRVSESHTKTRAPRLRSSGLRRQSSCSAGATMAFQPVGSLPSETSPASRSLVVAIAWPLPTPGIHESASR